MGQIQITRRSFSLSGSQLHIQMEVNYEGLQMPSDVSLTLTPFLLAGEQSFDLPSVLIIGRKCTSAPVYWVERPIRATAGTPRPR